MNTIMKDGAHLILTKINGLWLCAYDLIYDRKKVGLRFRSRQNRSLNQRELLARGIMVYL